MADPGKIALMLELQLAAGPAMKSLELFEEKFSKIEKIAANVGKAMAATATAAAEATEAAAAVAVGNSDTPVPTIDPAVFADYGKLNNIFTKHQELLEQLADGTQQLSELNYGQQRQVLSMARAWGRMSAEEQQAVNVTEKARQGLQKVLETGVLKDNAIALKQEYLGMWNKLSVGIGHVNNAFDRLFEGYNMHVVLAALVNEMLGITIDEQNEFAKANYRAAGSITGLQTQMRILQGATAASSEEAMKAGQAVFMSGIRASEGQELILEKTVKLAAAYGVSESAAADYAARIMAMGGNSKDAAASMEYTAKAISKAGLSAQEADRLFADMTEKMWAIYALTGSRAAADNFGRAFASLTALAREAKVPLQEVQDTVQAIAEGSLDLVRSGVDAGELFYGIDALKTTAQLMDSIPGKLEAIDQAPKFMRNTLSEAQIGIPLRQARSLDVLRKKMDTLGIAGATTEEKLKNYQEQIEKQQSIDESYQDTLNTLTGVLKQALIPVLNLLSAVLVPVGRAVAFLMKPLSFIGEAIGKVYSVIAGAFGPDVATGITGVAIAIGLFASKLRPFGVWAAVLGALSLVLTGLEKVMSGWPAWLQAIGYAATAAGVALLLFKTNLVSLFTGFGKIGGGGGGIFKNIFGFFKKWKTEGPATMEVPKTDPKTTKSFFEGLADGLTAFGKNSGKIVLGAATFALAMTMMIAPVILVAWVVRELGVSATDLAIVAGALLAGMLVMALVMPILAGVGAGFMALIVPIAAFALGMALIGAALIPGAYAIGLLAGSLKKFNEVDAGKVAAGFLALAVGLAAFGLVAITLAAIAIAFGVGAAALIVAFGLMAAAMLLFPTSDFGEMSKHLERFADAVSHIPSNIGNIFAGIRDVLDDLDDMEDVNLTPLIHFGTTVSWIADRMNYAVGPMVAYARAFSGISSNVDMVKGVDLYQLLAGNIIDNEDKFKRATTILKDYADNVAKNLEKVHGLADSLKQIETLAHAETALKPTADVTTLSPTNAVPARLEPIVAANEAHGELLEKQLEALKEIASHQDGSKTVNDLLVEIRNRLDEIIDNNGRNAMVNPASMWQA